MQLLPPCFQLTRDENDSKSALYTEGTNTKNSYVVKAALRNRTSIHEATSETLSAVNIQVAFWISMSTTIRETNAVFKSAFDIDVTNVEYGLKADGLHPAQPNLAKDHTQHHISSLFTIRQV